MTDRRNQQARVTGAFRRVIPLRNWDRGGGHRWPLNWLAFRIVDPALEERLRRYATGDLLDIGCGGKPYQSMAAPYVGAHVGLEMPNSPNAANAELHGTAYDIPSTANSFDTVLLTDVLEHLEDPQAALTEALRVLKPGGNAIVTVPLFWHLHEEPRDFFRYTKHGLRYLFETTGFEVIEITPLTGFVATFAQELSYALYGLRGPGPTSPTWWLVPPVVLAIQSIAYPLTLIDRSHSFTFEYVAVAHKPADAHSE